MRERKPYHIRKIDDFITLTEEICKRDYDDGARFMNKECERLNNFFDQYYSYEISWTSEIKSQREVHFFLTISETMYA